MAFLRVASDLLNVSLSLSHTSISLYLNPLSFLTKHAEFTHGKIRFTCTIYYAAQFDALRRQCGIDKLYLQSLSRCISWNVSGGKSKSIFFKTQGWLVRVCLMMIWSKGKIFVAIVEVTDRLLLCVHNLADDRLVLKQMVSSWNIAEKDALLKFAPKYFEYMDKSAEVCGFISNRDITITVRAFIE